MRNICYLIVIFLVLFMANASPLCLRDSVNENCSKINSAKLIPQTEIDNRADNELNIITIKSRFARNLETRRFFEVHNCFELFCFNVLVRSVDCKKIAYAENAYFEQKIYIAEHEHEIDFGYQILSNRMSAFKNKISYTTHVGRDINYDYEKHHYALPTIVTPRDVINLRSLSTQIVYYRKAQDFKGMQVKMIDENNCKLNEINILFFFNKLNCLNWQVNCSYQ